MFEFTQAQKRKRVQAVLTARMNQRCMDEMYGGAGGRGADRTPYSMALVVIPGSRKNWEYDDAFPALSRDISPNGLAILHTAPLEGELLVEIPGDNSSNFVRCTVQNCRELGHGYWQTGLQGHEVVDIDYHYQRVLDERMADFAQRLAASSVE